MANATHIHHPMQPDSNTVVDYYDNIADNYDDSRFNNSYGQFIDYEERRILDKLLGPKGNEKRLDMACGTGRLTGYATHALDASSEMMKHATKRHANVVFTQASASDTPFDDETFDVIYSFHLMMHLEPSVIAEIINEANRILKPGGRLIFDIPSKKRRQLLHHKQQSWHGATALTAAEVQLMSSQHFDTGRVHGIMMLPVHKLPTSCRSAMRKIDFALANGFLKHYSSYLVLELIKHPMSH